MCGNCREMEKLAEHVSRKKRLHNRGGYGRIQVGRQQAPRPMALTQDIMCTTQVVLSSKSDPVTPIKTAVIQDFSPLD